MILKSRLIPTQGDPENGVEVSKLELGILRLDASTHAERGTINRAADRGLLKGKRGLRVYRGKQQTLVRQEYFRQGRKQRGAIRTYLSKVTGLSLPQMTRLIRRQKADGEIRVAQRTRRRFPTVYTEADVALLAEVDRAHERLNGAATRHILAREYQEFGRKEFMRLSEISPSHIYNLRQSPVYRRKTVGFEFTRPTGVSIAERKRPEPNGAPGYIRIDTVHQGDSDGVKGVYHINAVDTVTQWQIVGCVEKIGELYMIPVLEAILHQFPFKILSFHSDNGSEYINHTVAGMLNKLAVEFTKSRANRSQDNALVEGKNGALVRKHIRYGHIPAAHAEAVQKFYTAHFNPYLNYHRPCGFAITSFTERGKRKRIYRPADYKTPYEKLKSLPEAGKYLKPETSFGKLDRMAGKMSDTECARKMGEAKAKLLRQCKTESPFPPGR
jgi:transposase InsO family protein